MVPQRILSGLTALGCCAALAGTAAAAQVDCDQVYCFSPADFSQQEDFAGICVTQVPDQGQVLLGSRVIQPGDVIPAEQTGQMTFCPVRTETDESVQVGYLPILEDAVEAPATLVIGIRGKENQVPVAEDSALETYKNLPGIGTLKVSDPEGEPMTFTLVREPRRGTVEIRSDGSFTYTPKKNKVGVDSFTYTAADAAGKTSREATVTITILKPTDAPEYTDTAGESCQFAAEWMKHTGIFQGERLGENTCFSPQRTVNRGEFVTMLVKALEIPTAPELEVTGYTDQIPKWLQPYLAAAIRSGLTAGLPDQQTFGAGEPITGGEAAVMLQNALDLTLETGAEEAPEGEHDVLLAALAEQGIVLDAQAAVTRSDTALALYQMVQILSQRAE